jgi:hypothetical protein
MKRYLNNEIIIVSIVLVIFSSTGCNRRQAAIEKVKELGGTVEIVNEKPKSAVMTVSLMGCKVSDVELGFLKDLDGLETLDLRNTKINGEELIHRATINGIVLSNQYTQR